MFRAASDDDIEEYSDSVTCFIRTCIEDVIPTKIIRIYPNQKPWINSDVRSALSARTSAFKSRNTDDRKQASYDLRRSIKAAKRQYKNKVEEQFNNNNPRSMWQGINNITGFKGNKPATVNIAASLPDELNTFYARFEAHNTAHTECAPTAAAEEVSPLSLSVADVTRSFKRVNIRKAVGPDGIPGRVLKACAYQLAGVFTDIFNLSLQLHNDKYTISHLLFSSLGDGGFQTHPFQSSHYLSTRSYPHSPPSSHFFFSHTCTYSHYQHLASHWYISHSI